MGGVGVSNRGGEKAGSGVWEKMWLTPAGSESFGGWRVNKECWFRHAGIVRATTVGTSEATVKTPSSVSAAVTETVWASTTTFDCLPAPVTSRDAALES